MLPVGCPSPQRTRRNPQEETLLTKVYPPTRKCLPQPGVEQGDSKGILHIEVDALIVIESLSSFRVRGDRKGVKFSLINL